MGKNRIVLKLDRVWREINPGARSKGLQADIVAEYQRALAIPQPNFPQGLALPENFGKGLPERVVELLLAHLTYRAGLKTLDVGHANAMRCHLEMIAALPQPRHLTGIDIAPETYDTRPYYEASLVGDVSESDHLKGQFDLVWCISTIEHIGLDNTGYTTQFNADEALDFKAILKMKDLLAPGGRLLVTVPFGKAEDHGWLRNYDNARWQKLLNVVRVDANIQEWYFRHTFGAGWSLASPDELTNVGYLDQHNDGAGGLAAALIQKT